MNIRIAVWDDEETATAKKEIEESGAEVEFVEFSIPEMEAAMAELVSGFEAAAPEGVRPNKAVSKLLDLDVLVIDENLRNLKNARCSTAEELVAPLRAFIGCPAIVILNRLFFDMNLTLVEEGLGDIDVKTGVLDRPWLWTDRGGPHGFAPWAWLPLARARESWTARLACEEGDRGLQQTVASALQLDPARVATELSATVEEALTAGQGQAAEPLEVTLQDFFRRGEHPVPFKYRDKLAGLADVVGRVCAAELALWLRRHLLAPQSILVDIPHLLLRAPWILSEDPQNIELWNACAVRESLPEAAIKMGLLRPHLYPGWNAWAGRPCFYWLSLRADPEFQKERDAFDKAYSQEEPFWSFIFLEDKSVFAPAGEAVGFKSAHGNIWSGRHVSNWATAADGEGGRYTYGPVRRRIV